LFRESRRHRKQRRTVKQLYRDLVVLGFTGSYDRVAAFSRQWRQAQQEAGSTAGKQPYVPLHFAPGEAFQFDWSEDWVRINGISTKLQIAHFKLSYSRAFFMQAYLTQTHEMLFDAHYHAFKAFGGIPQRGIYDNMKTAVDRIGRGKQRQVNQRFYAMVSHYLFEPDFCTPASGWEKGQVEKAVQDARHGLWYDPPPFKSLYELNRYSVPASFANRVISLRVYPERLVIVAEAQVVAEHVRVFHRDKSTPGRTVYDWRHYLSVVQRKPGALRNGAPFLELPDSFRQLQSRLLKRSGGDREMADILALVLLHDEGLVAQAVVQALESGEPSKQHVLNCLSRLQQPRRLQPLKPPLVLTLVTEPLADTARYDQLRSTHHEG
jgi:hypothetical protein